MHTRNVEAQSLSLSVYLSPSFFLSLYFSNTWIHLREMQQRLSKMFYFDANAVQQTLISVNTVKGIRFVLVNVNVALIMF